MSKLKEDESWRKEWVGMPTFHVPTRDTAARNLIDVSETQRLAAEKTSKTNRYPIYIISKGRHNSPKTARALDGLGTEYRIVVEPQEYEDYASVIDPNRILVLPFSNLGQGSIPARNWVLEHSIANGDKKHWILDDNIAGFGYQQGGRRVNTSTNGDFFRECEDFVDRYGNVKMAGIRYRFHHNYVKCPYLKNTRIYSCILMDNSITHRWRGKFNEDTDLSLRVLKDGECTLLFTWCYCNKAGTMSMKGGNTDEIYAQTDDRREFAESLEAQHPDVVKVVRKFGRWHHQVDYRPFKNNIMSMNDEDWRKEWVGMPEFESKDLTSHRKVIVHFRNDEDVEKFAELMGQKITKKQPSLWYPTMEIRKTMHLRYVESEFGEFDDYEV